MTPNTTEPTLPLPLEEVAIGLGSNLGNRLENLQFACEALSLLAEGPLSRSTVYETQAVDCPDPIPFLNAVVVFQTRAPAGRLLEQLHQIEAQLGRSRPYHNAPRPLDLDLLYYGGQVRTTAPLLLPHPRMHQRAFVLIPLAEIRPDWIHPTRRQSIATLKQAAMQGFDGQGVEPAPCQWPDTSSNRLHSGDLTTGCKAATML